MHNITNMINFSHIMGIFLRDAYIIRRSWHRLAELFFWGAVTLFLWGFITLWIRDDLLGTDSNINFVLLLIGGMIFWEMFYRAQQGISVTFLEEVWTRNIVNIFVAPIRASELLLGLMAVTLFKIFISFVFIVLMAWALYAFHVWDLGFYIAPFVINLFVFGFSIGIITTALILRFGPSIEIIAWALPFTFQPFSAVFYPVSVLPEFLQKLAFFIPIMHLFEGMRSVLVDGNFPLERVLFASVFNVIYFVLSLMFFYWILRVVRKRGMGRFVVD